jgi:hypothetical protein
MNKMSGINPIGAAIFKGIPQDRVLISIHLQRKEIKSKPI